MKKMIIFNSLMIFLFVNADLSRKSIRLLTILDNGPAFPSRVFLAWAQYIEVDLQFIQAGKLIQNAYIESFKEKLRDECLNMNWFMDLNQAKEIIGNWRDDYNRPHSSLNYLTPNQ